MNREEESGPMKLTHEQRKKLRDTDTTVIVDTFRGVDWWRRSKTFPVFTVYKNPKDFPGKYVVRPFDGKIPYRLITVSDTLEQARATIPPFFFPTPRHPTDEPHIVETWI